VKEEIDGVHAQVQSMRLQFEGGVSASGGGKSRQEGRRSGMSQRAGAQIVPVTSEIVMRDRKGWGVPEKDAERMVE
jgi:hypothetical protein